MIRSLEVLYLLGALDNEGKPTNLGKQMNLLPLAPELAKVLLSSSSEGDSNCVAEVIDIIACMSASSASSNAIFLTPNAEKLESKESRKHFASAYGDHITLLQAFREYLSVAKAGSQHEVREWCAKWGLNRRVVRNVLVHPISLLINGRKSKNNSFHIVIGMRSKLKVWKPRIKMLFSRLF